MENRFRLADYPAGGQGLGQRLEFRLGHSRAVVAITRRLLIIVRHVLHKEIVDRHHVPLDSACSLIKLAYAVKVRNLPDKQSAIQFTKDKPQEDGKSQVVSTSFSRLSMLVVSTLLLSYTSSGLT
jgi:hypothetical protein